MTQIQETEFAKECERLAVMLKQKMDKERGMGWVLRPDDKIMLRALRTASRVTVENIAAVLTTTTAAAAIGIAPPDSLVRSEFIEQTASAIIRALSGGGET